MQNSKMQYVKTIINFTILLFQYFTFVTGSIPAYSPGTTLSLPG